jgi:hypothetical protein
MEAAAVGEPGSRGVQKRAFIAQGFRSRVLEAAPEACTDERVVPFLRRQLGMVPLGTGTEEG